MADSDLAGFGMDPRSMRNPYPHRVPWPHLAATFDSPHRANLGTNANAVQRSATPLHNQQIPLQSNTQSGQIRPSSHGQDRGYPRLPGRPNPLSPQLHPQSHIPFDQQLGQQHAFATQYNHQPHSAPQPMNPTPSLQTNDQSSPQDWSFASDAPSAQAYPLESAYANQISSHFFPLDTPPVSFPTTDQSHFHSNMNMGTHLNMLDDTYLPLNTEIDPGTFNWQEITNQLQTGMSGGLFDMAMNTQNFPNSPTDTSLEVRSLSSSDNGWASVECTQYQDTQAIFNPGETLHGRTFSDSSYSDADNHARRSWDGYVDVSAYSIGSPSSDGVGGIDCKDHLDLNEDVQIKQEKQPTPTLSLATVAPIKIKTSKSPQRSPTQKSSPPNRRQARKNSIKTTPKGVAKKQSPTIKVENEKRIGRRKGPLSIEQRKQASEIRKLGACLRCKFLKKTCDKGEPCQGCLPSHARLWQVPCTRIDIKEIAFFMKDWKADVDRDVILHFSVDNIKAFATTERCLFISHGYGHCLPVQAREISVRDDQCFGVDWVETFEDRPREHSVDTAKMCLGLEGISDELLSEYLDSYVDHGYEDFIEQYFEGTPFVTEMLLTVHRYFLKEPTPVLRKTLKFLVAYNLTQHVTYVECIPEEEGFEGKIFDRTSKFNGKTVAPVMINFSVKIAMAKMWRELQKEVLEELSSMYSSVYSKEKLRHWPTIFMVACILLAVWEEMQFDCHYRVRDKDEVNKFCNEMENIPIKVVVGLFHAISQKLPSLQEWDSRKHHATLNSNNAICEALTEVRHHVTRHDQYLRSRCDTKFDCDDFDSLSSKFMSKLVIRAPAA